jgi:acyl-[acyl-carrier-protein] desaturase
MIDQRSHELLQEIAPQIERAHAEHTSRLKTTPIRHLTEIEEITGSSDITDQAWSLRGSLERHTQELEDQGIDIRSTQAASYLVGILTEDNLPYYTSENSVLTTHSEPMNDWLKQWTTEERKHGDLMQWYGRLSNLIGGTIDTSMYETGQTSQLRAGMDIEIKSAAGGFAYLSLQERVTAIAHQNTGWLLDQKGRKLLTKIVGDESRHHNFYTKMTEALLDVDPDNTVIALRDQYTGFEMPGRRGIPSYDKLAGRIALARIFDEKILLEAQQELITKHHKIADRQFTSEKAKQAQQDLLNNFDPENPIGETAKRIGQTDRLRAKAVERAQRLGKKLPLILGQTVQVAKIDQQNRLVAVG